MINGDYFSSVGGGGNSASAKITKHKLRWRNCFQFPRATVRYALCLQSSEEFNLSLEIILFLLLLLNNSLVFFFGSRDDEKQFSHLKIFSFHSKNFHHIFRSLRFWVLNVMRGLKIRRKLMSPRLCVKGIFICSSVCFMYRVDNKATIKKRHHNLNHTKKKHNWCDNSNKKKKMVNLKKCVSIYCCGDEWDSHRNIYERKHTHTHTHTNCVLS